VRTDNRHRQEKNAISQESALQEDLFVAENEEGDRPDQGEHQSYVRKERSVIVANLVERDQAGGGQKGDEEPEDAVADGPGRGTEERNDCDDEKPEDQCQSPEYSRVRPSGDDRKVGIDAQLDRKNEVAQVVCDDWELRDQVVEATHCAVGGDRALRRHIELVEQEEDSADDNGRCRTPERPPQRQEKTAFRPLLPAERLF
jgi:hypothetical protein